MSNYIDIFFAHKAVLHLTENAKNNLKLYSPAGCPFEGYSMLDLLIDLIEAYSWKMNAGRKYSIKEFLELTNDIKAVTYKSGFIALIEEV